MSDRFRLPARTRGALVLAACACWALPAPARAWTRTSVERVQADLRVDEAGQAEVVMQLGLRVAGGWLSQFEITGLDPDFVLDPQRPPTLTAEDGSVYAPRVEAPGDGRLLLSFEGRRSAPHRGAHQVQLAYTTQLEAEGKRVRWSLPAWGVDLRDVRVGVEAPRGAVLGAADEDDVAVQRERVERDGRVWLTFRRAQLARTLPLRIAFDLAQEVVPAREREREAGVAHTLARLVPRPSAQVVWAGALVLALGWLKRRAVRALSARHRLRPLPLVRMGARTRGAAMLSLALVFCFGHALHATLALAALAGVVVLAFDHGFARARKSAAAAQRPRHAPDALDAWFGASAWFDATTPLGSGLLASAFALAGLRIALHPQPGLWLELLLIATPLWLTSTRLHLPRRRGASSAASAVAQPAAARPEPQPEPNSDSKAPPIRPAGEARPAPDRAA